MTVKIPGAKTIIKYKGGPKRYNYFSWKEDETTPWSYIYLKSIKKIKKKNGVDFIYKTEELEWVGDRYDHTENGTITIRTIRSMFQRKLLNSMKFTKESWEAIIAKTFLIG